MLRLSGKSHGCRLLRSEARSGGGSARSRSMRPHATPPWRVASTTPPDIVEIKEDLCKMHSKAMHSLPFK